MQLITSILLLLVVSRALAELMLKMKQPAIVGEILAGILLGPALLNIIQPSDSLKGISELSVFLIVLKAGLEMEFKDVIVALKQRGLMVALLDFLLPFVGGLLLGKFYGLSIIGTVLLALCLSITALPVTVRILDNFGLLKTQIAQYSIAAAILNDIGALLFLGVILDMPASSTGGTTLVAVVISTVKSAMKLLLFATIVFIASRVIRWGGSQTGYIERGIKRTIDLLGKEALFGLVVVFVLAFGSISENLGSHSIIGVFFGALLLSRDIFGTTMFSELENNIQSITSGFLAPIFFAYLGLHFSVTALTSPVFTICVIMVSMLTKIAAGWAGARWIGMSAAEALGVGIIINARGIMELVVANIAYEQGLIDQNVFSILVLMGIFTTIMTPLLFKKYVIPKLSLQIR